MALGSFVQLTYNEKVEGIKRASSTEAFQALMTSHRETNYFVESVTADAAIADTMPLTCDTVTIRHDAG